MKKLTKTEKVLLEMLKENTGEHFLDSGGAYGRHWQSNQGVDFTKRKEGWWSWPGELSATKDLFHWLSQILEYDAEGNRKFQAFCRRKANRLHAQQAQKKAPPCG